MLGNRNKVLKDCRILVVVEPHSDAARLLRIAKRRAESMQCTWEALFLQSSAVMRSLDLEEREHMQQAMNMAEQMGAIVTTVQTRTSLQTILSVIAERRREGIPITTVITGAERRREGLSKLQPSLAKQLKPKLREYADVTHIAIGSEIVRDPRITEFLQVSPKDILLSLCTVLLAILVIETIRYFWPGVISMEHRNKSIIFMTACAFSAVRFGLLGGLVAGVASFLAMSALYLSSTGHFNIDRATDGASLALFLIGVTIVSFFGSREHNLKEENLQRADRLQSLLRLHRITLNQRNPKETIQIIDSELTKLLKTRVVFFLPSVMHPGKLEPLWHDDIKFSENDEKTMNVAWEESKTTGAGSSYNPTCRWRFEPLITSQGEIGVLGVYIAHGITLDAAFASMVNGIADQAALIFERIELGQLAEDTRVQAEREKLRAMLLSSVSHDLKTPLASVIGALSVYRTMGAKLPEEQRSTLIITALDEAQRLDSFITNILDMTRIESGQVEMKSEWVNPQLLIPEILKRLRDRVRNHVVTIQPNLPSYEVLMDRMMTGQVIQNLLDNAAKYTPAGTQIDISWHVQDGRFHCDIRDHGPGVPEDQFEKVFDKYTRIRRQDSQIAGTGLGLAIARAVMHAQNGFISVANHPGGGAIFTLTLPQWRESTEGSQKVA